MGTTKKPNFTDKNLPESPAVVILSATAGAEDTGKFTFVGDLTASFPTDSYFIVRRSTGNDATYKVKTATFSGGNTDVKPYGGVTSGVDDGYAYWPYYYYVTSVDKEGNESAPSSTIVKTSPTDVIAPATPVGLTARRLEDYSGVQLFWQENTEDDLKGYVVYRTYDGVTYHIATILSNNTYKDDDIPRGVDPLFDATYVAYAVAAYDKSGNIGVSTSVTGFFTIPAIRGLRHSIDFLSLNVSWTEPLPEDNISGVAVWYKKKVDTDWTLAGIVDWPTSRLFIDGPLDKGTEYDLAIGTYISSTYPIETIDQGNKKFVVSNDHVAEFPAGAVLVVTGSIANDGQYTIVSTTLTGGDTHIVVAESIPSPLISGSVYCFTLQVPVDRVVVPDYDTDIVPPTDPWALYGRADPQNDRIFLSWSRVFIDDDFLRYEILTLETGGQYVLHGTSRDNNYILNDASFHTRPDDQVYCKVRAVDRSGNISGESSFIVTYYSIDIDTSNDFRPQWATYTEDYFTSFKHASMRKYSLAWNDAAELALFFRRYVIYVAQKANVTPYADRFDLDGEEILAVISSNQFTYSTFQDENKAITDVSDPNNWIEVSGNWTGLFLPGDKIVISSSTGNDGTWTIDTVSYQSGSDETRITVVENLPSAVVDGQVDAYAILIWLGVEDWFGATYMGPSSGILAILST